MSNRNPTSSPLSSAQSSQVTFRTASPHSSPRYQPARVLPFELLQHVQIYIEEKLFTQALRLLQTLVSTSSGKDKKKIAIPPPNFLAVFATLAVHPDSTTRAKTRDAWLQSNSALHLLQTINKTTDPVNAHLTEAYRFSKFDAVEDDDPASDWKNPKLATLYAERESLFTLKDDFWAVVGWALNCSCLSGPYLARWDYWKPWLEYMLEVLEADWEIHDELGTCAESLIWQYIEKAVGGFARPRRMLRAVFVDGGQAALNEFSQVFRKELRQPRSDAEKPKKPDVVVDVDEEIYGDYLEDTESDTDDGDEANTMSGVERPAKRLRTRAPPIKRRQTPHRGKTSLVTDNEDSDVSASDNGLPDDSLGPHESISIRLRLLQLLSSVSAHPNLTTSDAGSFFPDLHELYTLFVEFVRPLPLSVFHQLVMPSVYQDGLIPDARIILCEFLLQRIVDQPSKSKQRSHLGPMTQGRLVEMYLPFTAGASTIEMQAKMSLLIEAVVRQLMKGDRAVLKSSAVLLEAVYEGIKRRESKADGVRDSSKQKKATNKRHEETAYRILLESGRRLRFIGEQLKA